MRLTARLTKTGGSKTAGGGDKREEKKKKILDAALKIFSHKGYEPANLEDVARKAGVAKGTLYLYFRDKEDLFSSTIMFVVDGLADRIRENVSDTMEPFEILRALVYHQFDFFAGNRDFFSVFHSVFHNLSIKDHRKLFDSLHERQFELLEYIRSVVERGKREGSIRKDIATDDIVCSFGGMVMNITGELFRLEKGEQFDPARKTQAVMAIALEGISARGAPPAGEEREAAAPRARRAPELRTSVDRHLTDRGRNQ